MLSRLCKLPGEDAYISVSLRWDFVASMDHGMVIHITREINSRVTVVEWLF